MKKHGRKSSGELEAERLSDGSACSGADGDCMGARRWAALVVLRILP